MEKDKKNVTTVLFPRLFIMHLRLTCSIPSCPDLAVFKLLHGLFHFKLRCSLLLKTTAAGASKTRGWGRGRGRFYLFFKECCFRVRVRMRVRSGLGLVSTLILKQHSLKKERP